MNPAPSTRHFLRVAVPSPLRRLFDYLPPPDVPLPRPGVRVRVPFGRQRLVGIVVSLESDTSVARDKLKTVLELIDDEPLLDTELLRLYLWAADYYMFPVGLALQTSLPAALREGRALEQAQTPAWRASAAGATVDVDSLRRAPQQQRVLELLRAYQPMTAAELGAALEKPAAPALRALLEKGFVERCRLEEARAAPRVRQETLTLNAEQAAALACLGEGLDRFGCHLLEGITGSGKTEVYLQLITAVLAAGRQVLVLVPEISLTPQTIQRFTERFDCDIVTFHSGLTDRQRFEGWARARAGGADIVIGTRSAVFTPLPRLGLIIVDEEHDASYKQQEGFRYSARDLAVYRARQLHIPVLLGSATPSLESLHNALAGRYTHLHLARRAGAATQPELQLVDMRLQEQQEGFSATLLARISGQLAAGRQVLVFLNRRGFAPILQCLSCGWIAECPRCDRSYTLHQQPAGLRCHHCEAAKPLPRRCPTCDATALGGIGQGTERSEAFLRERFADFPVLRIDRDSTRAAGSLQDLLDRVGTGEPCILVGTQMLAKGHHFPRVTLVAVLDADSGLFSADFRGQEALGQLLTQVAGRAGRSDDPGRVLIQSFHVQHPGLRQLVEAGYGAFARDLLALRREGGLPPFSRLLLLRAEANARDLPQRFLERAKSLCLSLAGRDVAVHGPLPSPIGKKAGLFRAQLILQASSRARLQRLGHALLAALEQDELARRVRWQVDVDPIDFS